MAKVTRDWPAHPPIVIELSEEEAGRLASVLLRYEFVQDRGITDLRSPSLWKLLTVVLSQ
jgi:hypothetical protein